MTWDEVIAIASELPDVEVSTAYGTPALKTHGKFLTRLRSEDDSLVFVDVPMDERDLLIEADPCVFHITPHYQGYPSVLARLDMVDAITVRRMIERRWRNVAPRRVVKAYDAH
ncbi:MAG: MmcQ/YjbR family DNA-binding protein [Caulobacteraceae bacterium]